MSQLYPLSLFAPFYGNDSLYRLTVMRSGVSCFSLLLWQFPTLKILFVASCGRHENLSSVLLLRDASILQNFAFDNGYADFFSLSECESSYRINKAHFIKIGKRLRVHEIWGIVVAFFCWHPFYCMTKNFSGQNVDVFEWYMTSWFNIFEEWTLWFGHLCGRPKNAGFSGSICFSPEMGLEAAIRWKCFRNFEDLCQFFTTRDFSTTISDF